MSFRLQPYVLRLQVQLAHAAQQLLTRGGVEREANTRVLELHLRHCRVQLLVLRAATHLVRVRVRVRAGVKAGVRAGVGVGVGVRVGVSVRVRVSTPRQRSGRRAALGVITR